MFPVRSIGSCSSRVSLPREMQIADAALDAGGDAVRAPEAAHGVIGVLCQHHRARERAVGLVQTGRIKARGAVRLDRAVERHPAAGVGAAALAMEYAARDL